MKIKICGVRTERDAQAVRQAGVELAGLNFIPGTSRFLRAEDAASVRRELGGVEAVGVFRDQEAEAILDIVEALDLRWVQLHGREPLATVRRVASRCAVIRSLVVTEVGGLDLAELGPLVSAFLVDGPSPGSGHPVSHAGIGGASFGGRPFFVAGGLRPENVADVVRLTRPDGVDVATGVTSNGTIDPSRLASFVQQARGALAEERR